MNNEFNFAYCAGYLDGDGCFYVGTFQQNPQNITVYEHSIQVLSIKRGVLDKFCLEFGGAVRTKEQRIGHKVPYTWAIKGEKASNLAASISDMLVDKKIACELFIKFASTIVPNCGQKVGDAIIQQRKTFIDQIKEDRHMHNFVTKEAIESLNDRKNTVDPIPRDYAYLAGLIDSEGCFRVKHWLPKNKPNHVYAISLEIGNTKFPILPWLIERFGGNISFIPEKPGKRAVGIWNLSAKSLYEILPRIYPFLTNKKDVCQKLMEFQQTIIPNGGDRHSELFHALFTKNRAVRDRIVEEIHVLNAKGSHK